jgi:hypothetical protein
VTVKKRSSLVSVDHGVGPHMGKELGVTLTHMENYLESERFWGPSTGSSD